jgi:hypothetical protein
MSLTYYKSRDKWGLLAQDGDATLVFSGLLKSGRIWKEILAKIFLKKPKVFVTADPIDVYQLFSPAAKKVWNNAVWMSVNQGPIKVGCIQLFLALIQDPTIKAVFSRFNADLHDAKTLLNNYMILYPPSAGVQEIKKIPFAAFAESEKLHAPNISPLMLLYALIEILPADNILQAVFGNLGLTPTKLEVLTVWLLQLNYEFPDKSFAADLLHCCQKISYIEQHNKIKYKLDALEQALIASNNNAVAALKLLVQAASKAQKSRSRVISSLSIQT